MKEYALDRLGVGRRVHSPVLESSPAYHPLPIGQTDEATPRHIGLELEFSGIELDAVVEILKDVLGAEVEPSSRFSRSLVCPPFGTFRVELDAHSLKERTYADFLKEIGFEPEQSRLVQWFEDSVVKVAQTIVPVEIVTPPLKYEHLDELEPVWLALAQAGAKGTHNSLFNAFGLHLNPEVPSLESSSLLAYLRAFLLLYDWLIKEEKVDISRRLTPFIFPFPELYRRKVLSPQYQPDQATLIEDYLELNPTRNRPLDMLPVFAEIAQDRVEAGLKDSTLVSSRPTFHYRLPNCDIGQAGWSPAAAWNRWVEVERLANDEERLTKWSHRYLATNDLPFRLQGNVWADDISSDLE